MDIRLATHRLRSSLLQFQNHRESSFAIPVVEYKHLDGSNTYRLRLPNVQSARRYKLPASDQVPINISYKHGYPLGFTSHVPSFMQVPQMESSRSARGNRAKNKANMPACGEVFPLCVAHPNRSTQVTYAQAANIRSLQSQARLLDNTHQFEPRAAPEGRACFVFHQSPDNIMVILRSWQVCFCAS